MITDVKYMYTHYLLMWTLNKSNLWLQFASGGTSAAKHMEKSRLFTSFALVLEGIELQHRDPLMKVRKSGAQNPYNCNRKLHCVSNWYMLLSVISMVIDFPYSYVPACGNSDAEWGKLQSLSGMKGGKWSWREEKNLRVTIFKMMTASWPSWSKALVLFPSHIICRCGTAYYSHDLPGFPHTWERTTRFLTHCYKILGKVRETQ